MAYGSNPGGGGGTTDYFSDSAPEAPKTEANEDHAEGETGILPKSLMAGKDFKPGEEIVLKIEAVHENDFVVSYAEDKGEDEHKEEGGEEAPMETAGAPPTGDSMMD